jgi:hypothetical protein
MKFNAKAQRTGKSHQIQLQEIAIKERKEQIDNNLQCFSFAIFLARHSLGGGGCVLLRPICLLLRLVWRKNRFGASILCLHSHLRVVFFYCVARMRLVL